MSRAIIIGGRIGGLAAAAALARVGVECDVFEQAQELREVGAGLTLWAPVRRLAASSLTAIAAMENICASVPPGPCDRPSGGFRASGGPPCPHALHSVHPFRKRGCPGAKSPAEGAAPSHRSGPRRPGSPPSPPPPPAWAPSPAGARPRPEPATSPGPAPAP